MKTSLAIVLATAALMVGATVDAANAGYSNKGAGYPEPSPSPI